MTLHRGNLFLVGMMGAGKSTVGRSLAKRLGKRFVDADHELEARTGVAIATVFEVEGESGFRDREEALCAELTGLSNIVLATGGGVVLREASRSHLREGGTVLYLHAPPEILWQRLRGSRHRPLLQTADPRARLAELYAVRDPLYREIAHHVVESERDAVTRFVHWLAAGADPAEAAPRAADVS
ncbi:MAG TPA: shikimate kinase [Casimicrobiaceae bacterium]|jgi:shikimate kinase